MHLKVSSNHASKYKEDNKSLSDVSIVSLHSDEGSPLAEVNSNFSEILISKETNSSAPDLETTSLSVHSRNYPGKEKSKDKSKEAGKEQTSYSADIQPLMFKMNIPDENVNIPETHNNNKKQTDWSNSSDDSLNRNLFNIKQRLINVQQNSFSLFNSIDEDQLTNYLKNPNYIKLYRKRKDLRRFSRMFMAQELIIDAPVNNPDTNVSNQSLRDNQEVTSTLSPVKSSNSNINMKNIDTSKAIWVTKFSTDGRYMATAGKDGILRVWKVISSLLERMETNDAGLSKDVNPRNSMRSNKTRDNIVPLPKDIHNSNEPRSSFDKFDDEFKRFLDSSNRNDMVSLGDTLADNDFTANIDGSDTLNSRDIEDERDVTNSGSSINLYAPVFKPQPIRVFQEHSTDILELDWSRNGFIITASTDKSVKLWHPDKSTSLRTFQHPDFVTSVKFHPSDDRFFISGCVDQKCRLWSILDENVSFEYDCQDLVTTVTVSDDGVYTIIGTLNGYVHVLETKGLKFHSVFHVRQRVALEDASNPGEAPRINNKLQGPRITGLQCFRPNDLDELRILATCDDSKARVIRLSDRTLLEYLKGFHSGSTQHQAHLSTLSNVPVVISSSDDHWVYFWSLQSNVDEEFRKSIPKTGIHRSISVKTLLAKTLSISKDVKDGGRRSRSNSNSRHHHLHVPNLLKCKKTIRNSAYISFHAHTEPVTTAVIAPSETTRILSLSNDIICELSTEYFSELKNKVQDCQSNSINQKTNKGCRTSKFHDLDTDLNLDTHLALPNMLDAVGTIIVTTDNRGNIRVFRVDMPLSIRKMVLDKLKDRKVKASTTQTSISSGPTNTQSFYDVDKPSLTATNIDSMHSRSKFSYISNSSSSSNRITARSTNDSSIVPSLPVDTQCSVCNGTKFELKSDNELGSNNVAYHCVDCGTVYNNFR